MLCIFFNRPNFHQRGELRWGLFFMLVNCRFGGLTISGDEDINCNKYDNCTIPLYEHIISSLGVRFPFTTFKVYVLIYLMVALSQLHPTNWMYVKAYLTLKENPLLSYSLISFATTETLRPVQEGGV